MKWKAGAAIFLSLMHLFVLGFSGSTVQTTVEPETIGIAVDRTAATILSCLSRFHSMPQLPRDIVLQLVTPVSFTACGQESLSDVRMTWLAVPVLLLLSLLVNRAKKYRLK